MALVNSAIENKKYYSKEEALIRMIALGIVMKLNKGSLYYRYIDGLFYVSETKEFEKSRYWDTDNGSLVVDWINC